MKAAVGGAVAAGAFMAPRVEGLSVVPAYASAASGVDASVGDSLSTVTKQANTAPLCLQRCCVTCWNATGVNANCAQNTCVCGSPHNKSCGVEATDKVDGTLTINKNSPAGSSIDLAYSLWGPTEGCSNQTPSLNLALSGIDAPYQSCNVTVTPTCSTGTAVGGMATTPVNANGPVAGAPLHPGCSGSVTGTGSAQQWCAAPATLTITLACTFS